MGIVIKNHRLVQDDWLVLREVQADLPAQGKVIVPWRAWQAQADLFAQRDARELGIWFAPDDTLDNVESVFSKVSVLAIDFPIFSDGRGYSLAYLLRSRLGWSKELRAIGDVLRDQLYYLNRCGFDAFALQEDQNPEEALQAFQDFSEQYQASVFPPLPLFKRYAR